LILGAGRASIRFDTNFAELLTTGRGDGALYLHCFSKEIIMKAWIGAAALAVFTMNAAQAGDVSWTVTVGSPQPRVIYTPPPVIYTPPPVVYRPAPVVYQPAPVVYHQAPVYYVPYGHAKKWHKHQHRYAYHPGAVYVVKGKKHRDDDDD
jgi:hypothetical protein